jgi:hypothetical protein
MKRPNGSSEKKSSAIPTKPKNDQDEGQVREYGRLLIALNASDP